ncbi:Rrf2 family transcriptional regulator [Desulfuromonas acetoxidans]|uniref:Transcriptional regulator, BadM/Rrf2 family n=1 Tax=Desulfuromonas acetoxidans (strain DSM 684 / 11070) TaxID=281689 RepID=Q1JYP9_DESA6|nr:Rrf2 family transcriptional regulator [Desulfuromonas acetoxidans]EAT15366.1 transcriptional regulator, BadM/Rrf2 family [Desulfuromonas acetoxidans DSM 684]MBF0646388.1 Rrf2 family transcriptional regulator [Desulfuromonas acetoxidans]NVD24397.1 Rrf2 family transcriptional regulator [Desulfuromonas acetoxidans]NVE16655.1 Rrf2 family transcriptional regulator [Desulfuromonas acetoxidans]
MRLSTKAQYAVRAMVRLSLEQRETPVSIREISNHENISLTYLEQLFAKLRRGELVRSVRGPGGGYVLARPADQIKVDQIIDSVEETLIPVSCMDEFGNCACSDQCVTHTVWQELGERIRGFLSSVSIEDLTREAQERIRQQRAEQSEDSK